MFTPHEQLFMYGHTALSHFLCLRPLSLRVDLEACAWGSLVELPAAPSRVEDICLNHHRGTAASAHDALCDFQQFMADVKS